MNPKHVFVASIMAFSWCCHGLAGEEALVRLPEVVVTEDIHQRTERWRYARLGNFEIISQTNDPTILKLAKTLELVPWIVNAIWPAPNVIGQSPTEIILCDSEKTFEGFVPSEVARAVNVTQVDRLFFQDGANEVIVLKCDKIDDEGRFREILRDYARRCLLSLKQRPPDWFVTGMAEVITDADYSVEGPTLKLQYAKLDKVTIRGGIMLNRPSLYDTEKPDQAVREIIRGAFDNHAANAAVSDDDTMSAENNTHERFNSYFAQHHYHPALDEVLRHDPSLNPDDYRMTCWAFVHLCAFAQKRGYQRPLRTLLQLAGKDPAGDILAQFRKAFGESPQRLDSTVIDYATTAMSHGVTKQINFPAPTPIVINEATLQQFTQLKADAYRLSGHSGEAAFELNRGKPAKNLAP